jgi:hypothetical protein
VLTIFSTPKPFKGHIAIIQRNALLSWKLLHPDIEIILFGDERGTAEVCSELGLLHEPNVERTSEGTKLVRSIFGPAQSMAQNEALCYVNGDIILGQDFVTAIQRVSAFSGNYLMAGCRWDFDLTEPLDFSDFDWEKNTRERVLREGVQRLYHNIDYFAFSKGLYQDIPDIAIGRIWWDHWLLWKASQQKAPLVDASDVVMAMHQNHDYSYHPEGWKGIWLGEGAKLNFKLAGGYGHMHTLEDANFRMTRSSIEPCRLYWLAPARRAVRRVVKSARGAVRAHFWHPVLEATRSFRHAIGLHQQNIPFKSRKTVRRHEFDE